MGNQEIQEQTAQLSTEERLSILIELLLDLDKSPEEESND